MQIIIDTSKLATPFKALGRGVARVYNKAAQVKLDMEARALLRRIKYETAVQVRAMELEPMALSNAMDATLTAASVEPKKPSTKERGTSRLKPAAQPRRRTPK